MWLMAALPEYDIISSHIIAQLTLSFLFVPLSIMECYLSVFFYILLS